MPKVRMIEEYEAEGHIGEIYRDIRQSLRVSLVGSFFKTLAYYPDFLDSFWNAIKPNLSTGFFLTAAKRAQAVSDSLVGPLFAFSDDYAWLRDHYYSREDMREIRYAVEMFHYMIPKIALISSHLKLSLYGGDFSPRDKRESDAQEPDFSVKVQIVRPESAPKEIEYIYRDILDTTRQHILPHLYQVLARWPEYLKHVWYDEVKPVVFTNDYRREAEKLGEAIDDMARQLPYPAAGLSDILRGEAKEQVLKIAGFFHKVIPGEMIVVSGIRNMLVEGERADRASRDRLERSA